MENVKELNEAELEKANGGHKIKPYRGTNAEKRLIRELISDEERAILNSLRTEQEKKQFYADHKDLVMDYKRLNYAMWESGFNLD
jgi:hypothetical protein